MIPSYLSHRAGTCERCKTENVLLTSVAHPSTGFPVCLICRGELQPTFLKAKS
jgi:hypothetical protein